MTLGSSRLSWAPGIQEAARGRPGDQLRLPREWTTTGLEKSRREKQTQLPQESRRGRSRDASTSAWAWAPPARLPGTCLRSPPPCGPRAPPARASRGRGLPEPVPLVWTSGSLASPDSEFAAKKTVRKLRRRAPAGPRCNSTPCRHRLAPAGWNCAGQSPSLAGLSPRSSQQRSRDFRFPPNPRVLLG